MGFQSTVLRYVGPVVIPTAAFALLDGVATKISARSARKSSNAAADAPTGSKFCVATSKAGWRSALSVPDGFTARGCDDFSREIGGDDYVLGCTFDNGTIAIGTGGDGVIGHGSPSPDCGWSGSNSPSLPGRLRK